VFRSQLAWNLTVCGGEHACMLLHRSYHTSRMIRSWSPILPPPTTILLTRAGSSQDLQALIYVVLERGSFSPTEGEPLSMDSYLSARLLWFAQSSCIVTMVLSERSYDNSQAANARDNDRRPASGLICTPQPCRRKNKGSWRRPRAPGPGHPDVRVITVAQVGCVP
jgi:hypothetical protein